MKPYGNVVRVYTLLLFIFVFLIIPHRSDAATIGEIIAPPAGYTRMVSDRGSFSEWVQTLPLKDSTVIALYNGQTHTSKRVLAVVDRPLLYHSDLEQCADYCMRFWAEYHRDAGKLDDLYLFDYSGNRMKYTDGGKPYDVFLKTAMMYSNSHSIKAGCEAVDEGDLRPGDMIVQNEGGGIGHVSMIVDMAEDSAGNRLYLIGYSFMPAQEFHIEKAPADCGREGWFTIRGFYSFLDEYLDLGKPVLRRFAP